MQKILVDDKVFIFLDHPKLVNEAFKSASGNYHHKYVLRGEIFNFRPKTEGKGAAEVRRKKRKRTNSEKQQQQQQKGSTPVDESELLQVPKALKKLSNLFPLKDSEHPLPRYWEELSAGDFPKFKGGNSTKVFQSIGNLIDGAEFLVPPFCRFYNYDIRELSNYSDELDSPFDVIVLDPPWRNKYIRRLKRHQLGYEMMDSKELLNIPFEKLINSSSIVLIWCTNSKQHQEILRKELLPAWKLRSLHTLKWLKLNTLGEPISEFTSSAEENGKQPFEMLYIACHLDAKEDFGAKIKEVKMLMSVPSIIHSHKPPLLPWLREYLPLNENPKCLELFARYLQPHFTSFGLEVLKLMDQRLYIHERSEVLDGS